MTPIILQSYDSPRWALLLAEIAVLLHMLTAYQVYGQALFDTVESHIKWLRIKRAAAAAAIEPRPAPAASAAKATGSVAMPTPFEAAADPEDSTKRASKHKSVLGLDHVKLDPISERMSSLISADMGAAELSSLLEHLHSVEAHVEEESRMSRRRTSLRDSMYAADTGFANEEVPANAEGFLLPFWMRLVVRSTYVLLLTLLASIMPFFSAFAGLVGAVTFFPLAIYFPFACYRKVYPVTPGFSAFLWVIWGVTGLIAIAATIGAVRTIIVGWSTFEIFGT